MDDFNDFYWHDAEIKAINIDRHCPGKKDEIQFKILFPDKNEVVNLIFEEVYYSSFTLNFGIIADETVKHGSILENDDDLSALYSKWKGCLNHIKLYVYLIELNSSGSKIKIIAKKIRVEE